MLSWTHSHEAIYAAVPIIVKCIPEWLVVQCKPRVQQRAERAMYTWRNVGGVHLADLKDHHVITTISLFGFISTVFMCQLVSNTIKFDL